MDGGHSFFSRQHRDYWKSVIMRRSPNSDRKTANAPAGRLLFALALTSYLFWLLHSFAIRNSFSAIRHLLLKSGLKP
jgi:hypothetical protein